MKRNDQLKTSNGQNPLNGPKIGTVKAESPADTATSTNEPPGRNNQ